MFRRGWNVPHLQSINSLLLLVLLRVRADTLALGGNHVDEALVVEETLPGAAHEALLLVFLGLHVGSLVAHLTGASERTVNLTCVSLWAKWTAYPCCLFKNKQRLKGSIYEYREVWSKLFDEQISVK